MMISSQASATIAEPLGAFVWHKSHGMGGFHIAQTFGNFQARFKESPGAIDLDDNQIRSALRGRIELAKRDVAHSKGKSCLQVG